MRDERVLMVSLNGVVIGAWEGRSKTMCTSARDRLRNLEATLRDVSSEITAVRAEIRREEDDRYVGVQFHGNSRIYTYELRLGNPVGIGDYVAVYSPRTEQSELVRVVRKGRGSWKLGTKIAHRVEIQPID